MARSTIFFCAHSLRIVGDTPAAPFVTRGSCGREAPPPLSPALSSLAPAALAANLDPAAVRKAAEYSADHRGTSFSSSRMATRSSSNIRARCRNTPQRIYSGTKAFWNLAALAAAEDGILDLDERVADTIAAWRKDPRKSQVTIRQLLDFSCGLAPGFSACR